MVQNSDIHCFKDHHPSISTTLKVQTQGTTTKEPHSKEFRLKEIKLAKKKIPALLRTNMAEFLEQDKKNRKDKK